MPILSSNKWSHMLVFFSYTNSAEKFLSKTKLSGHRWPHSIPAQYLSVARLDIGPRWIADDRPNCMPIFRPGFAMSFPSRNRWALASRHKLCMLSVLLIRQALRGRKLVWSVSTSWFPYPLCSNDSTPLSIPLWQCIHSSHYPSCLKSVCVPNTLCWSWTCLFGKGHAVLMYPRCCMLVCVQYKIRFIVTCRYY